MCKGIQNKVLRANAQKYHQLISTTVWLTAVFNLLFSFSTWTNHNDRMQPLKYSLMKRLHISTTGFHNLCVIKDSNKHENAIFRSEFYLQPFSMISQLPFSPLHLWFGFLTKTLRERLCVPLKVNGSAAVQVIYGEKDDLLYYERFIALWDLTLPIWFSL